METKDFIIKIIENIPAILVAATPVIAIVYDKSKKNKD